jgi:hypothetical protein
MDDEADYTRARRRLKTNQIRWASEQFGQAIKDSDAFRAEPVSVAWEDPIGVPLDLVYYGRPDGSVYSTTEWE